MAIEGKNLEILDRLIELTEAGKLEWKHDGSVAICNRGEWVYSIYLARDGKEFYLTIWENEKRLCRMDANDEEVTDAMRQFYAKARAMEPAASILKALEGA